MSPEVASIMQLPYVASYSSKHASMTSPTDNRSSRERLIYAAEQLFAERGLDGVSLREINRTAKCRNATAIQYHFKNKEGLLFAVINRHVPDIEAAQRILLDDYEADPSGGVRALAGGLVHPYADKLATESGRYFLQVYAAALNQPTPLLIADRSTKPGVESSMDRWRRLVEPLMAEEASVLHRRFAAIAYTISELGRRARADKTNQELFTSMLRDSVAAMLSAPTSDETRQLLALRDQRKKP